MKAAEYLHRVTAFVVLHLLALEADIRFRLRGAQGLVKAAHLVQNGGNRLPDRQTAGAVNHGDLPHFKLGGPLLVDYGPHLIVLGEGALVPGGQIEEEIVEEIEILLPDAQPGQRVQIQHPQLNMVDPGAPQVIQGVDPLRLDADGDIEFAGGPDQPLADQRLDGIHIRGHAGVIQEGDKVVPVADLAVAAGGVMVEAVCAIGAVPLQGFVKDRAGGGEENRKPAKPEEPGGQVQVNLVPVFREAQRRLAGPLLPQEGLVKGVIVVNAGIGHLAAAIFHSQIFPIGGFARVFSLIRGDGDLGLPANVRRVAERPEIFRAILQAEEPLRNRCVNVIQHLIERLNGITDRRDDFHLVFTEIPIHLGQGREGVFSRRSKAIRTDADTFSLQAKPSAQQGDASAAVI